MLKNLNKTKKKKGFTLIELVIVLAVLAIIALIAIPNFNKVRTDSKVKADLQTAETIKNVTTMAIANQDIKVKAKSVIIIRPKQNGTTIVAGDITGQTDATFTWGEGGQANYVTALKEVKKPQQKDVEIYTVTITLNDNVETIEVVPGEPKS